MPSIVVHADNLKPYRGEKKINWVFFKKKENEEPELPHLDVFQNKDSEVTPKTNFENRNRKSENQQNNYKITAEEPKPATDTKIGRR